MLHLKGKIMTLKELIGQTIKSVMGTLLTLAVYGGIYTTAGLLHVDSSKQGLYAFIAAGIFFFLDALYDGIWGN